MVLGLLLSLRLLLAGALPAPPDTLPHPLPPVVAPTDTLVQLTLCPAPVERLPVSVIGFAGNAVTKARILRAELDFQEGDTLSVADLRARLEANRRRLYNLQLFHAVLVQASCQGGRLTVVFGVQERWYTFPVPILSLADRNFRSWLDRSDRWRRIDYGLHLTRTNFCGRNEQLLSNLQFGFNRKYELFYEAPGLGRYRRLGLGAGVSYYQSHTVDYATVADRLVPYYEDEQFAIQRFYALAGLRFRHTVQFLTALNLSYHNEHILDSVRQYNPAYYLGRTQRQYIDLSLVPTRNQRNTFAYPLTGQFLRAELAHRVFLDGSTPTVTTAYLYYARYLALGGPFYYSVGLSGQVRFGRQLAYADRRALGYDALVRGYDKYVIDGRYYGLVQQGFSCRLFDAGQFRLRNVNNPKINTIPLVLYLNAFTDAGYVGNSQRLPQNRLPNRLLGAVGVGLHVVTYYDRVLTVEYTLNALGETGYFVRTEFPI